MHDKYPARLLTWRSLTGTTLLGILCLGITACSVSEREARRTDTELNTAWPQGNKNFKQVSLRRVGTQVPTIADAEYINDDELCMTCHDTYVKTFQDNVHRGLHEEGQSCEACHGPGSRHMETRGQEPGLILSFKNLAPVESAEVCLKCHEQNACTPGAKWRTSAHAHNRVTCTDCHQAHYNVPPGTPATTEPGQTAMNGHGRLISLASFQDQSADQLPSLRGTSNNLGALTPQVCLKCHQDMRDLLDVAGPHQLCGPNGFNCTTCHDAHGNIVEHSRKDLCLQCHGNGSPTMAWHSSTHDLHGVACTDCHNPHPRAAVQRFPSNSGVSLMHTNVARPKRLAMSVQEPQACYKCHPKIFGLAALPSHHPIKEGKMVCSDCHDAHGQQEGNIKAEHVTLLCWKCHADKQGPFAYEHPPVTEDCGICHNPHGTVTNNLLKQPPTFLCLRCHVGHRDGTHGGSRNPPFVNPGTRTRIDDVPQLRPALYTDCMQCHSQIHGSDLPTPHFPGMFR